MSAPSYSPGLEGVVAGETAIADLSTGLTYRGYAAETLAENATYEEVAYLVMKGELPNADQLRDFSVALATAAHIPDEVVKILGHLPPASDMMDVLRTAVSLLGHWDPESGVNTPEANERKAIRLIAQTPVALAARYRQQKQLPPVPGDPKLGFAGRVLQMIHGDTPPPDHAKAMDVSLILYAEHGFNASTFTARVCCSTLSDMHSAATAAIGALKGPLHGGANERALEVLLKVQSPDRAESWIRDALARKERIMGFGHRVYKDGDPRAVILQGWCSKLAASTGGEPYEKIAAIIEKEVLEQKRLKPNVDWPCARLYHYLGLPEAIYTPLFVVGRMVGWCTHISEQLAHNRLIRPEAIYTGPANRDWVPLAKRK